MVDMQIGNLLSIAKPTSSGKNRPSEVGRGKSGSPKSFKDIIGEKDFSDTGKADSRNKNEPMSKAQPEKEEDIKPDDKRDNEKTNEQKVKNKSNPDSDCEKAVQAASAIVKSEPVETVKDTNSIENVVGIEEEGFAASIGSDYTPDVETEKMQNFEEIAETPEELAAGLNVEDTLSAEAEGGKQLAYKANTAFVEKSDAYGNEMPSKYTREDSGEIDLLNMDDAQVNEELEKILSNLNLVSMKMDKTHKGGGVEVQAVEAGEAEKPADEIKPLKSAVDFEIEDLAEEVQGEGVKPAQGNQEGKGFQNMQHSEEHFSGIEKRNAENENSEIETLAETEEAGKFMHDINRQIDTKSSQMSTKNQGHQVFQKDIIRQINQQMKLESTEALKSLEIKLEPENLGKVVIKIVSENGIMSAKLVTANDRVKQAIDSSIEELKESLSKQGIDIEAIDVSVDSNASRESFEGLFRGNAGIRRRTTKPMEEPDEVQFGMDDLSIKDNPYRSEDQEFDYLA